MPKKHQKTLSPCNKWKNMNNLRLAILISEIHKSNLHSFLNMLEQQSTNSVVE